MKFYNETYTKYDIFVRSLYLLKMCIHSIPKINAVTFIWYSKMAIWA